MKQPIFLAAALLLSLAAADAAAQSAVPSTQLRTVNTQMVPNTATIARVDPIKALQDQITQLKEQVAALKQANDALAAKIQSVDSGLGQVVTQNLAQAKQIHDQSTQISDLSSKLANHRHSYTYNHVEWTNKSFVTEAGGIGSSDKKDLASYVSAETDRSGTTGPAE